MYENIIMVIGIHKDTKKIYATKGSELLVSLPTSEGKKERNISLAIFDTGSSHILVEIYTI